MKIRRDIPSRRQKIDLRGGCEWTAVSRRPGRTCPTTSKIWHFQNWGYYQAAFQFTKSCFFLFHYNLPASSTLRRRLPAPKPNLSGASSQDASTPLSTRSRRVGRSSVDGSGCLGESSKPASFLQRIFTHNRPPDHGDGAEDTGHDSLVLTHAAQARHKQFWREKNYNPIQADTTFDTVQQHHHLTHY